MASDNPALIRVEVAYARPDEQVIIPVEVATGATMEQAILQSRIQERFPDIDPVSYTHLDVYKRQLRI